jgi:ABC-type Zn2+ transport system substrate-binding protein/surface adhesin
MPSSLVVVVATSGSIEANGNDDNVDEDDSDNNDDNYDDDNDDDDNADKDNQEEDSHDNNHGYPMNEYHSIMQVTISTNVASD